MCGEKMSLENPNAKKPVFSSVTLGVCCCALAAMSYTAANACLKQLSTMADPAWTTFMKEAMAFAFAGLCLFVKRFRGLPIFPSKKEVGILLAVGLAVEFIGNLGVLWAMGKVGLAVTIPTNSGAQLLVCALFGWILLGERVSLRTAIALALLMVALILLGFGAEAAGRSTATAESSSAGFSIALAVAASCLAGVAFASLSIAMRRSCSVNIAPCSLLFIVAGVGVGTMLPMSCYRMGVDGLLATSPRSLAWMLSAGVFNLIGFFGFAKGLQLTSIVHASVLNASQVAMSAVVGMVYFQEPHNPWLVLGVIVTMVGIMLIDRPPASETVEVMV
jgi:drug/metabolite transporter (DMT)-like permease